MDTSTDTKTGIPVEPALAVERIATTEGFRALESVWSQLLEGGGYHTVFQTHTWLLAWWECLQGENELYLLVVRDSNAIRGIAPLMLVGPHHELRFIGTPNTDYNDIIGADKEALWRAIIRYVQEHRSDWTVVVLDQLTDRADSHMGLRSALAESGLIYRTRVCDTCMAYQYDGAGDVKSFEVHKSATIRKALKHFEQMGRLEFRRLDENEALRELPNFFHLHIVRWGQTATPSKFVQENHRRFYTELVKRLSSSQHIYFSMMSAGDVPVAYCMKFAYNGTVNHYTLAYNPYFTKWSPGVAFIIKQTERLVREGHFLDFSRGAQDYKQVMTNRTFQNYEFVIFNAAGRARWYDVRSRIRRLRLVDRFLAIRKVSDLRAKVDHAVRYGDIHPVRAIIGAVARILYQHFTIDIFSHKGPPRPAEPPIAGVEIRELNIAHLPLVATFYGAPHNGPKYRTLQRRFENGGICFGAFCHGNLATASWGLPLADADPSTGFVLIPKPGTMILSDGVTSLPYRGLGLRSYLLHYEIDKYYRMGKGVTLATLRNNSSMLHVVSRYDFEREYTTHIVRVLGLRIR